MIDKDEVKETIVSEARQVFSKLGFRKTRLDNLIHILFHEVIKR